MDGMDDFNAPMPPTGSDNMGLNDEPNGMDDDPMNNPIDTQESPIGGEDNEFMDIIDSLSTEDKAAVLKYAKSMADDSKEDDMGNDNSMEDDGQMPMESITSYRNLIDETINDVLDDYNGTERPNKELPKEYKSIKSPFKSPY